MHASPRDFFATRPCFALVFLSGGSLFSVVIREDGSLEFFGPADFLRTFILYFSLRVVMQKVPLCSHMALRSKVEMVTNLTPVLLSDPAQYVTELFEIGECINLFKQARRYVLGQIRLNSDQLDAHTHELLAQWIDLLADLSPLEEQICHEISAASRL